MFFFFCEKDEITIGSGSKDAGYQPAGSGKDEIAFSFQFAFRYISIWSSLANRFDARMVYFGKSNQNLRVNPLSLSLLRSS